MKNKSLALITFLSFFLQALIPVGFMPSFANDTITIEICSGLSTKTITIQKKQTPSNKDDHDETKKSPCQYMSIGSYDLETPPSFPLTHWALSHPFFTFNSDQTDEFPILFKLSRAPPFFNIV